MKTNTLKLQRQTACRACGSILEPGQTCDCTPDQIPSHVLFSASPESDLTLTIFNPLRRPLTETDRLFIESLISNPTPKAKTLFNDFLASYQHKPVADVLAQQRQRLKALRAKERKYRWDGTQGSRLSRECDELAEFVESLKLLANSQARNEKRTKTNE
jgi:hypothetical protein